jgi:hypothetical protein
MHWYSSFVLLASTAKPHKTNNNMNDNQHNQKIQPYNCDKWHNMAVARRRQQSLAASATSDGC